MAQAYLFDGSSNLPAWLVERGGMVIPPDATLPHGLPHVTVVTTIGGVATAYPNQWLVMSDDGAIYAVLPNLYDAIAAIVREEVASGQHAND